MEIGEKIGKPTGCQYLQAVESLINEKNTFPWKEEEIIDQWGGNKIEVQPTYVQMSLYGMIKNWYDDPQA